MKNIKETRGAISLALAVGILLVGVIGTWFGTSRLTDKGVREAKAQQVATAQAREAERKLGAEAAAGVTQMGVANGLAPESPSRNYMTREITNVLGMLPSPDPVALLEAERRRVAVMEGQLKEANRLYGIQTEKAATLLTERDMALKEQDAANLRASESAAQALGAKQQKFIFIVIACICAAAFVYRWINSVSPNAIAEWRADVLGGAKPVVAMDAALNRFLQKKISKLAKQKVDLPDEPQA